MLHINPVHRHATHLNHGRNPVLRLPSASSALTALPVTASIQNHSATGGIVGSMDIITAVLTGHGIAVIHRPDILAAARSSCNKIRLRNQAMHQVTAQAIQMLSTIR